MSVLMFPKLEPSRFSPQLIRTVTFLTATDCSVAPSTPSTVALSARLSRLPPVHAALPRVATHSSSMANRVHARGSTDVPVGKKSSIKVSKTHDDDEACLEVAATIDDDGRGDDGDDLQYGKTLRSRFATISGGKGIERRETRGDGRVLVGHKANLEERSVDGPAAAVDAALAAASAAADPAAAAPDAAGPAPAPFPAHEDAGSRWDTICAACTYSTTVSTAADLRLE